MRKAHLITVLVGFAAVALLPPTASAMYNPKTGRFLQRDPRQGRPTRAGYAGPNAMRPFARRDPAAHAPGADGLSLPSMQSTAVPNTEYADGMNLYCYCRSAPIVLVDPVGLEASDPLADCSSADPCANRQPGSVPQMEWTLKGFGFRPAWWPGTVVFKNCSASQLRLHRVLPEHGESVEVPENDIEYKTDGFAPCDWPKGTWFKVPNYCDATVTCSATGSDWWSVDLLCNSGFWLTRGIHGRRPGPTSADHGAVTQMDEL